MTEPLTITTAPRSDRQLDLTIALGPERTEEALQRAAKQVAKRVNIPGFRRGKAPYGTILRHFGREALLNEIMDEVGQEVYQEALEIEKIQPFAQPKVEDIDLDPPTIKLVVPLPPEVDLAEYRSVRVEKTEVSVSDADVDQVIAEQRANRATWVEIDRPAEMGDTVTVDIKGTVGEDTIMDNHDWDLQMKEETGWLPGFAEAFVGMKAGDQKTFTVTYPEDSASRYKGQEATFDTTVKTVKARLEPELNDEFAKTLGDFQDVADLRTKLQENLQQERTNEAESKLNEAALEAVIAQAHLEYPPAAVDDTLEDMLEEVRRNLTRAGYGLEDYVRLQGLSMEDYQARLRPQAEKRLQGRLVLGKLAEAEAIEVSADEIEAETNRLAPADATDERAQSFREALNTPAGQAVVRQDLLTEKTLARLREFATGGEAEAPAKPKPAKKSKAAKAAAAAQETAEAVGEPAAEDEKVAWEGGTAVTETAPSQQTGEENPAEEGEESSAA